MKRFISSIVCVGIILSSILAYPSQTKAYYTYMPASVVVGQTDFTSNSSGLSQTKLSGVLVTDVFVDPNGRFMVADQSNNRVLIWNQVPSQNGAAADLVLGQADFTSGSANRGGTLNSNTFSAPTGIWSDGTKLMVGDTNNNRVLVWNSFPTSNGQSADVVIGQANMTANDSSTCNAATTRSPYGVTVYNGKLIIGNAISTGRIFIYNSIPTTNGASADVEIGQPDMTTCTTQANNSQTLNNPRDIRVTQDGKLIYADGGRRRVMIYNQIPTTNFAAADVVVGQADFTSNVSATTANGLVSADSIAVSGNRLFVADSGSRRVLIFNSIPTTNGASADVVIGQNSFTTLDSGVSAQQISTVRSVFTTNNQLFLVDRSNARVLIFNNVVSNPFLNIKSPLTSLGEGRLRVVGDVVLGERGTYSLQKVLVDVNGQGYGNVSYLSGGRDGGNNNTLYDFYHDFEPWAGSNGDFFLWKSDLASMTDSRGYTLKIKASSFNADDMVLFYFLPFKLTTFTNNPLEKNHKTTFKLNKYQIQRLKDNIDHFEVEVRKTSTTNLTSLTSDLTNPWTKYGSNIQTSLINTDSTNTNSLGEVTTYLTNTLTKTSQYEVRIVSVSKESAWRQYSNTMTLNPTTKVTTTLTSSLNENQEPTQTQLPEETPLPTLEPLPTTTPNLTQTNNNFTIRGLLIGLGVLIPLVVLGVFFLRKKANSRTNN